jgi:hypothetical protein
MTLRRIATIAVAATLMWCASATAVTANYEDWWWNDQQSGHGLNIGQQNDVLFVAWFTYDETGAGMWLTMSGTLVGTRLVGDWVRTTGPALGTAFDPTKVVRTVVGTGTLTFGSLHTATLDWTVNGKSGSVQLTRMSWASHPPSGAQAGRAYQTIVGCTGSTFNLPVSTTYNVSGDTIAIIDDYRPMGTRVCSMVGTLVPSGSYFFVSGNYSCDDNAQTGPWQGTLLMRPQVVARDEVLSIDGSACLVEQSVVTSPLP